MNAQAFANFDEVVNRLRKSEVVRSEYLTSDWRQETFSIVIKGKIEPLPNGAGVLVHYPQLGLVFPHAAPKPGEIFIIDCHPEGGQGYRLSELGLIPPYDFQEAGYEWFYDFGKLSEMDPPDGHRWEWNEQYQEFGNGQILPDKQKNGLWAYFWPNGHVKTKGGYQDGIKIGIWNYFYPTDQKKADLVFDNDGHLSHYQGWYVDGNIFCRSGDLKRPMTPGVHTDLDNVNTTGNPSLVCFFDSGVPMYSYYGPSAGQGDVAPDSIINWPNGKPALNHYSIVGDGGCYQYSVELCAPGGGIFFDQEQMEPYGGAATGCPDPINKVVHSILGAVTDVPDGPVTLGTWTVDLSHGYEPSFSPVLTASFKNGKLDGLFTVKEADLIATFPFHAGMIDGVTKVDGETPHAYEYKLGKFIQEDSVNPDP